MNTKSYPRVVKLLTSLLLSIGFLIWLSPPLSARDFQVLYDLRVDGNVNTQYGGIGRYQNLLTYSEQFNENAVWSVTNSTVTANSVAAPDGTTTADTLTSTVNGGEVRYATSINPANKTYTFSVWLKTASGTQSATLNLNSTGIGDVAGQTVTVTTSWERFFITGTAAADKTGNLLARIFPGSQSGMGTVYAWGAQLEEASSMGVYVKTTTNTVTASRGIVSDNDAIIKGNLTVDGTITGMTATGGGWTDSEANVYLTTTADNVGIGTTAPISQLQLTGILTLPLNTYPIQTSDSKRVMGSGGGINTFYSADTAYQIKNQGDTTALMYIQNTGNVGIGTTAPTANLDILSTFATTGFPLQIKNSGYYNLYLQGTDANDQGAFYLENDRGTGATFTSYGGFFYGGSTTSLGSWMGRARADRLFMFAAGASNLGMVVGTATNVPFDISTNAIIRMTVLGDGNVGIGTTGPGNRLEVKSSGTNTYPFSIEASDGSSLFDVYESAAGVGEILIRDASGTGNIYLKGSGTSYINGGNVGIGTTGPSYLLDTAGRSRFSGASLSVTGGEIAVDETTTNLATFPPSSIQVTGDHTASTLNDSNVTYNFNGDYYQMSATTNWVTEANRVILHYLNTLAGSTQYRVSFWAKASSGTPSIRTGFYGSSTPNTFTLNTNWQRFSFTGTTQSTYRGVEFGSNSGAITWYVKDVQVESKAYTTAYYPGSNATRGEGDIIGTGKMLIKGNVGIGTTDPGSYKLYVNGSTYLGGLVVTANGNLNFGGNLDMQNNLITNIGHANTDFTSGGGLNIQGNVGIGTTGPGALLHILKDQDALTSMLVTNAGTGVSSRAAITVGENTTNKTGAFGYANNSWSPGAGTESIPANSVYFGTSSGATGGFSIISSATGGNIRLYTGGYAAANERLRIDSTGNVGIGTTAPSEKLEVAGAIKSSASGNIGWVMDSTDNGNMSLEFDRGATSRALFGVAGSAGALITGAAQYDFAIRANSKAILFSTDNGTTAHMAIKSGNVGIGTTGPGAKLSVIGGTVHIGNGAPSTNHGTLLTLGRQDTAGGTVAISLDDSSGVRQLVFDHPSTGNTSTYFTNSASGIASVYVEGNVGIGTTGPGYKLDISGGDINIATNQWLRLAGGALIGGSTANKQAYVGTTDFKFNASDGSPLVTILAGGNVGIGTTGPVHKLQVEGTAFVSDLIADSYGGFAESRTNTSKYSSFETGGPDGWVMAYGGGASGTLTRDTTTYVHGSSCGKVSITNAGTIDWHVAFINNDSRSVTAGQTYPISFWAKASANRQIAVTIMNAAGTDLVTPLTFNITTSWKRYWGILTISSTDTAARWPEFKLGNKGINDVYIDAVQIEDQGKTSASPYIPTESTVITRNSGLSTSKDLTVYGNSYLGIYSGNVGIGTTSAGQRLQVAGVIESTTGGFKYPDGTTQTSANTSGGWTDNGANVYLTTISDSVGIGTTVPGMKLDVNGSIVSGDYAVLGDQGAGNILATKSSANSSYFLGQSATAYGRIRWHYNATGGNSYLSFGTTGNANLVVNNSQEIGLGSAITNSSLAGASMVIKSGNVGIGTTGPTAKLDIRSTIDNPGIKLLTGTQSNRQNAIMLADQTSNTGVKGYIGWGINDFANSAYIVGIRVNDVNEDMHLVLGASVQGVESREQLRLASTELIVNDASYDLDFRVESDMSNAALFVQGSDGNVGIGTTGPGGKLHVAIDQTEGTPTFNGDEVAILQRNGTAGQSAHLSIISGTTGASVINLGDKDDEDEGFLYFDNNVNKFYIGHNGIGNNDVTIDSSGNVGIGTTGPTTQLQINGSGANFNFDTTNAIFKSSANLAIQALTGTIFLDSNAGVNIRDASSNSKVYINTTTGNVGIGTTGPTSLLTVAYPFAKTDTSLRRVASFQSNDSSAPLQLYISAIGAASQANRTMVIQTGQDGSSNDGNLSLQNYGGNVGIGTTNPGTNKLYVNGPLYVNGTINTGATTAFNDITVGGGYNSGGDGGLTIDSAGNLKLDGNIWVKGTTYQTNYEQLYIENNNILLNVIEPATDEDAYIAVMSSGTKAAPGYTGLLKWNTATDRWDFGTSGTTNNLYVSGNVGIGTTNPAAKLGFVAATNDVGGIDFGGDTKIYRSGAEIVTIQNYLTINQGMQLKSGESRISIGYDSADLSLGNSNKLTWHSTGYGAIDTGLYRNTAGVVEVNNGTAGQYRDIQIRAINPSSGNVGIGTTGPNAKLQVTGASNRWISIDPDYSNLHTIRAAGNLYFYVDQASLSGVMTSSLWGMPTLKVGYGGDATITTWDTNEDLTLSPNGSGDVLITTGSLGIGTTVPGKKLDVQGASSIGTTAFTGTGLNDATIGGTYTGAWTQTLRIQIDGTGTPNTFKWSIDGGSNWVGTGVTLSTSAQTLYYTGVTVSFGAATGHTLNDYWQVTLTPPTGVVNTAGGIYQGGNLFAGYFGTSNMVIGKLAMSDGKNTGFSNIAIGDNALQFNKTGHHNTTLGLEALFMNNTGAYNTAIGEASRNNTAGSFNTAITNGALYNNRTGSYNVALGYAAGQGTLNSSDISNNTLIGFNAGFGLLTGADNNILLGYKAGDALTTGANNIVIGYDIDAPSATGSNQLTIGNLIYATGINGTGTTISTGNVGIGTTGPTARLEISNGDLKVSGSIYQGGTALNSTYVKLQGTTPGTQQTGNLNITGVGIFQGNVGIGTTNPGAALEIGNNGVMKFTGGIGRVQAMQDDLYLTSNNGIRIGNNSLAAKMTIRGDNGAVAIGYVDFGSQAGSLAVAGNIGIGTTGPGARLDVAGTAYFGSTSQTRIDDNILRLNAGNTPGALQWSNNQLLLHSGTSGISLRNSSGNEKAVMLDNGSVGIGTSNPTEGKLEVTGVVAINSPGNGSNYGLHIYEPAGSGPYVKLYNDGTGHAVLDAPADNMGVKLATQGNTRIFVKSDGFVGIGTTLPEAKLDVAGPLRVGTAGDVNMAHDLYFEDTTAANIKSYGPLTIQSGNPNSNYNLVLKGTGTGKVLVDGNFSATGNIELGDASADTVSIHGTVIGASPALFVNQSSADDIVVVQDGGTDVFKILDGGNSYFTGNLGIGTTSPATNLDVKGNAVIGSGAYLANTQLTLGSGGNSPIVFRAGTAVASLNNGDGEGPILASNYYRNNASADVFPNAAVPAWRMVMNSRADLDFMKIERAPAGSSTWSTFVNIKNDGNVGIGTTAPGAKLELASTIDSVIEILKRPTGLNKGAGIQFFDGTNQRGRMGLNSGGDQDIYIQAVSSNALRLEGSSSIKFDIGTFQTKMIVDSNGNVGIGTTVPSEKLQVGALSTGVGINTYLAIYGGLSSNTGLKIKRYDGNYGFTIEDINALNGLNFIRHSNSAAGVSAMFIEESSGNVGIGTTSPNAELQVAGTINATVYKEGGTAFSGKYVQLQSSAPGTQQTGNLNISGSGLFNGNIGIGTATPAAPLTINTILSKAVNITGVSGADYDFGYYLNGQAALTAEENSGWLRLNQNSDWGNGVYTPTSFVADTSLVAPRLNVGYAYNVNGGTNNAIINGNVGIGTTSPGAKLTVYSTVTGAEFEGIRVTNTDTSSGAKSSIYLGDSSPTNRLQLTADVNSGAGHIGNPTGYPLYFFTNGIANTKLTILNSGNVGIGTAVPVAKLDIKTTANPETAIKFSGVNGGSVLSGGGGITLAADDRLVLQGSNSNYVNIGGSGADFVDISGYMRIIDGGYVGIGTTSPEAKLDVQGPLRINSAGDTGIAQDLVLTNIDASTIKSYSPLTIQSGGSNDNYNLTLKGTGTGKVYVDDDLEITGALTLPALSIPTSGTITFGSDTNLYRSGIDTLKTDDTLNVTGNLQVTGAGPHYISAGNVGIGTTSPGIKFDVNGGIAQTINNFHWFNTSADAAWRMGLSSSANALSGSTLVTNNRINLVWGTGATDGIVLGPNGQNSAMEINGSGTVYFRGTGNVGIGTTGPGAKLGFVAATNAAGGIDFGGDTNLYRSQANFLRTDDTLVVSANIGASYGNDSNSLVLGKNAIWRLVNTGTLSIGGGNAYNNGGELILTGGDSGGGFTLKGSSGLSNDVVTNASTISGVDAMGGAVTNKTGGALTVRAGVGSGANAIGGALTLRGGQSTGSGEGGNIIFQTSPAGTAGSSSNALVTAVTINSSGNVGIGTTSPQTLLHLSANSSPTLRISDADAADGASVTALLQFTKSNQSVNGSVGYNADSNLTITNSLSGGDLYLTTTGAGDVLINNGNVGIGTTGPTSPSGRDKFLHIQAATASLVLGHGTDNAWEVGTWGAGGTSDFSIWENTSQRVVIKNGGNVGIGTTGPSQLLHVYKSSGDAILQLESDGGHSRLYLDASANTKDSTIDFFEAGVQKGKIWYDHDDAVENLYLSGRSTAGDLTLTNTGNVGIGTTNPAYPLDVNGTIRATGLTTPYQHTITVAKSGGDYTTITAALNAITDNSSTNRYLIRVMPGIYNETVTMKQYVDIIGSGWNSTRITKADTDIITAASNARLEDLTVELTAPTSASTNAIVSNNTSVTINNVQIVATGGTASYLVSIVGAGGSTPTITNSYIKGYTSIGGGFRAISVTSGFDGTATISHNKIETCYSGIIYQGSEGSTVNSSYNNISCSDSDFWIDTPVVTLNSYKDTYSTFHNEAGTFNKRDYMLAPLSSASQALLPMWVTAPTSLSSNGTYLGVNAASGYTGDLVNLLVNNTSKFVVTGTGNVGIGTTTPVAKFHVAGDVMSTGGLSVSNSIVTPYGGIGHYENIMTYSDQLDHANWAKGAAVSVSSNATTAPDGTVTADSLLASAATEYHFVRQYKTVSALAYTFSIYAKKNTWRYLGIRVGNGIPSAVFDFDTETFIQSGSAINTFTKLANGWYRLVSTYVPAAGSYYYGPYISDASGSENWTSNGTESVYVWGAQLEQDSNAGVYAKTTSGAVAASRGIVSTGDILMPSLKLSGGSITDTTGTVSVGNSNNLNIAGNLQVTGAGPHYIQSGNVGIGTTAPSSMLHLASPGSDTAVITMEKTGTTSQNNILGRIDWVRGSSVVGARIRALAEAADGNRHTGLVFSTSDPAGTLGDHVFINNQGYVGIGNGANTPAALLSVGAGGGTLGSDGSTAVSVKGINLSITATEGYAMGITNAYANGGNGLLISAGRNNDSGNYALRVKNYVEGKELLSVMGQGNVGIGTTSPNAALQVAGTINATAYQEGGTAFSSKYVQLQATTPGTQQAGNLNISGTGIFQGNVGIGTTGPGSILDIEKATGNAKLRLAAIDGTNDPWINFEVSNDEYSLGMDKSTGGFKLSAADTMGTNDRLVVNNSITFSPTAGYNFAVNLSGVGDFAVNTNQLYVDTSTGNVGIGTTAPGAQLEIDNNAIGTIPLYIKPKTGTTAKILRIDEPGGNRVLTFNPGSYTPAWEWYYAGNTNPDVVQGLEQYSYTIKHNTLIGDSFNNMFQWYNGASGGLGGASSTQTFLSIQPRIAQSGTAGYNGLSINVTEASTGSGAKQLLSVGIGGTPKFVVNNSGSVGINTTSPEAKLDVEGTMQVTTAGDTGIAHDLVLTNVTSSAVKSYGPLTIQSGGSNDNYNLALKGTGTGKVYIDDDLEITGALTLPALSIPASGTITFGSDTNLYRSAANTLKTDDTLNVTGNLQVTGAGPHYISAGNVGIGTASPSAKATKGLTINQGAATDEILSLKGGSVAHGITSLTDTDTYGFFKTRNNLYGGLIMDGISSADAPGLILTGIAGLTQTDKTTGESVVTINAAAKSGTTTAALGNTYNLFAIQNNGTNKLVMDGAGNLVINSGNVGIGTTGPGYPLHVQSSSGGIVMRGQNTGGYAGLSLATAVASSNSYIEMRTANAGMSAGNAWVQYVDESDSQKFKITNTNPGAGGVLSGQGLFTITTSGNVGIGTTGPGAKLSINTAVDGDGIIIDRNVNTIWSSLKFATAGTSDVYFGLSRNAGTGIVAGASANSLVMMTSGATDIHLATNSAINMTLKPGGNVGIGTTGPRTKLDVIGNAPIFDVTGADAALHHLVVSEGTPTDWRSYGGSTTAALQIQTSAARGLVLTPQSTGNARFMTTNGLDIYTDATLGTNTGTLGMTINSGNIGIGTTVPDQKLETSGNILLGANNVNSFMHGGAIVSMSADSNILIVADSNDTTGPADGGDIVFGSGSSIDTDVTRTFTFADAYPTGVPRTEHMRIKGTGNIGIGTTDPGIFKLNVNGDTKITGTLTTTGTINGQTIGTTSAFNALTVGGGYDATDVNPGLTIDSDGNLKLNGDIWVRGTAYQTRYEELFIKNNTLALNYTDTTPSDNNAFIGVMSGGDLNTPTYTGLLTWNATPDRWDFGTAAIPNHLYVSGNVGIGTTGPTYGYDKVLHLYGTNPAFKVETNNATGWAYSIYKSTTATWSAGIDEDDKFQLSTADGFGSGKKLTIQTDGNVGIGTASPGAKLEVWGNVNFNGTPTTSNQARQIYWTGFDKEGVTDFTDTAYIRHTTNSGGLAGSVLEISSQNDSDDGINMVVTSSTSGVRINGNAVWHAGNDASGSGLDADLVDGYHASSLAKRTGYSAAPSTAGWYRIAQNGPVTEGGTGGNRAVATFTVRDIKSGNHSSVTFIASVHYGENPTLTVLNRSYYGTQAITKIRLVERNTYEGAAVEVYVNTAGTATDVSYTMYDNEHSDGWTAKNWEATTTPASFVVTQMDLDTYNPVIAIAANDNDNAFFLGRSGNGYFSGNVGIGTTNPSSAMLQVAGAISSADTYGFSIGAVNNTRRIQWESGDSFFRFYGNGGSYVNIGAAGLAIGSNYGSNTPPSSGAIIEGNVGIGTTNPGTYKLNISGSLIATDYYSGDGTLGATSAVSGLTFKDGLYTSGTVTGDNLGSHIATGNLRMSGYWVSNDGDNEGVFVKTDGAVGIGTSNPGYKLEVSGHLGLSGDSKYIYINGNGVITSSGGHTYVGMQGNTQIRGNEIDIVPGTTYDTAVFTDSDSDFYVGTNQLYVVGNTGNVGIGTTGPSQKLEVFNGSGSAIAQLTGSGSGNYPILRLARSGSDYWDIGKDAVSNGIDIRYYSGSYSNIMTILNTGNVGIGTTNPSWARLLISGGDVGINAGYGIGWGNGNSKIVGDGSWNLLFNTYTGSSLTEKMRITSAGFVGIGTTLPEAKLDVTGPLRVGIAGDVNMAHDLYFEDTTAANIKSYGPLTIQSGNPNSNYNLVLKGTGTGKVYIDDDLEITGTTTFPSGLTVASGNITASTGNISASAGSGTFATLTVTGNANLATTSGNVGIGTTNPTANLEIMQSAGTSANDVKISANGAATWAALNVQQAGSTAHGLLINIAGTTVNEYIADFRVGNASKMYLAGTGSVGIGTTNPGAKLDVRGNVYSSNSFFPGNNAIQTSRSFGDNGTYLTATNLKVAGELNLNGQLFTGAVGFRVNSDDFVIQTPGGNSKFRFKTSDGSLWVGGATADGTAAAPLHVVGNGIFTGNVGIGTTTPGSKLQVHTTVQENVGITIRAANANGGSPFVDFYADGADADWRNWRIIADSSSVVGQEGDLRILRSTVQGATPSAEVLTFTNQGNVGIGTTNPISRLELASGQLTLPAGAVGSPSLTFSGSPATGIYLSSTDRFAFAQAGVKRAEFGTGVGFKIFDQLNATPGLIAQFGSSGEPYASGIGLNSVPEGGWILKLRHEGTAMSGALLVDLAATDNDIGIRVKENASQTNDMFQTMASDGTTKKFAVGAGGTGYFAGNVGIGTTGSAEKLDVAGNIKLTGRIRQGSLGDVAEMMALSPMVIAHTSSLRGSETTYRVIASEAKQSFEIASSVASLLPRNDMAFAMPQPNDVVMIDRDGGIRLSDGPNSTAVIGVISVNPAQILREDLPNSLPVALSGTVPCKVTTENGPIYPGDLLTSSSKPGYAMKADPPKIGTIIGKAMESLENGDGEILIFVTRQ